MTQILTTTTTEKPGGAEDGGTRWFDLGKVKRGPKLRPRPTEITILVDVRSAYPLLDEDDENLGAEDGALRWFDFQSNGSRIR